MWHLFVGYVKLECATLATSTLGISHLPTADQVEREGPWVVRGGIDEPSGSEFLGLFLNYSTFSEATFVCHQCEIY